MGSRIIGALLIALCAGLAWAQPPGDAVRGRGLFLGERTLERGGASCISCHAVSGLSQLGGGSLGKDLTNLHKRMGNAGIKAMLDGLQFPVMREAYRGKPLSESEKADLIAYFKEVSSETPRPGWLYGGRLWGIGVYGAVALFALMLFGWPRQRRSLSERLRGKP